MTDDLASAPERPAQNRDAAPKDGAPKRFPRGRKPQEADSNACFQGTVEMLDVASPFSRQFLDDLAALGLPPPTAAFVDNPFTASAKRLRKAVPVPTLLDLTEAGLGALGTKHPDEAVRQLAIETYALTLEVDDSFDDGPGYGLDLDYDPGGADGERFDRMIEEEAQKAEQQSARSASTGKRGKTVLSPPSNPMQTAREFVNMHPMHAGTLIVRYWRDSWWEWATSHWREVERRFVVARLYKFTEHALYWVEAEKTHKPWAPNRHKIGDLVEALGAICILRDDIDQPCWLEGGSAAHVTAGSDGVIVACENGLLELETGQLRPHSPLFFNLVAVPFPYDSAAHAPAEWLAFLMKLWPGDNPDAEPALDQPEINALGEWFGYVISGRLDLHKILLMIGPTRGGKGVIARVLTALIGSANVAGPTLGSLGGEFGLAPLIGKSLAIISDARFTGRDSNIVVERLLSISGEDTLTVNRKFRDQWTGKLPSRLHVISNEVPKLGDASAAIVGRIVLLPLAHSWLGKEDLALETRIRTEMPGVLNWALDGLRRLTANGNRFTRLPGAEESLLEMRDLASPLGAFVREMCDLRADYEEDVDELYVAYKLWAENNGHHKSSKQVFGRDLHAAFPSLGKTQQRGTLTRRRVYPGIRLKAADAENADIWSPQ